MRKRLLAALAALCLTAGCWSASAAGDASLPSSASSTQTISKPDITTEFTNGVFIVTSVWPDRTAISKKNISVQITVTAADGESMASIDLPERPRPAKDFYDVPWEWYRDAVYAATGYGLFEGTSSTQFSPNSPMTRAMLVSVLHRLSGKPQYGVGNGSFMDVPDCWYTDSVDWAHAIGIAAGTGNGFNPNRSITREELITMIFRYANLIGESNDEASGASEHLHAFSDAKKVSGWAADAMNWAVAENIIMGRGNAEIVPQGTATRAEVAAILSRFIRYLAGHTPPGATYTCEQCGRITNVTPIDQHCYCDACLEIVYPPVCERCNAPMPTRNTVIYLDEWEERIRRVCDNCYAFDYCPTCQKYSTNVWEGYCDICDPSPRCKKCNARGLGRGLIEGYCYDCYEGEYEP